MAAKKEKDAKTLPSDDAEKKKALENALGRINKNFGKGSIIKLGENMNMNVSAVSTGSLNLDFALGIGGLPRGRIIEIFGPESSGKTTVALHCAAEVQKIGGIAAFIDAEHALDPEYAKNIGVDINELLVSQPDSGEQALDIAEELIRSCAVDIIVVDSVAALTPQEEIDGEMGSMGVGKQARLMSHALRKLSGAISKSNCILIFINQLREKVGVIYGNPETTPGGRALKFYASVRIDVRKGQVIKNGTETVGSRTKCKVVKNKVAPPFKTAEFDLLYGKGISKASEILDLAVELGIVEKSGSWFSYGEERIGQGRDTVREILENDKELAAEIEKKVREAAVGKDFGGGESEEADGEEDLSEGIEFDK